MTFYFIHNKIARVYPVTHTITGKALNPITASIPKPHEYKRAVFRIELTIIANDNGGLARSHLSFDLRNPEFLRDPSPLHCRRCELNQIRSRMIEKSILHYYTRRVNICRFRYIYINIFFSNN